MPDFTPTHDQETALAAILGDAPVVRIEGYAGTGKTSLLRLVADALGEPPLVIAPTGKASLRVREATGLRAHTVHKFLYTPIVDRVRGTLQFARGDGLECPSGLVVVDEASMVDDRMCADLRDRCAEHGLRLVLVGDGFQLPPVRSDFSVFKAPLPGPHVRLTQIVRQAAESLIVRAATKVRDGDVAAGLREIPRASGSVYAAAGAMYRAGGLVVVHRNATRTRVNDAVRRASGCVGDPQPGEPLMVLLNQYRCGGSIGEGLFNGEQVVLGAWVTLEPEANLFVSPYNPDRRGHVRFGVAELSTGDLAVVDVARVAGPDALIPDDRDAAAEEWVWRARPRAAWATYRLAGSGRGRPPLVLAEFGYAYTAHKAQGSEWPTALVVLESSVRLREEDGRRWLYTALTRARESVAWCEA